MYIDITDLMLVPASMLINDYTESFFKCALEQWIYVPLPHNTWIALPSATQAWENHKKIHVRHEKHHNESPPRDLW